MSTWIPIFDLKEAGGRATAKDVDEIVKNFNPSYHEPPVFLGHASDYPKDTRIPATGWIESIKREGTKVWAALKELPPIDKVPAAFASMKEHFENARFLKETVNKGYFPKRSVGIGTQPNGEKYLHHLAFLGASAPQCKGMPAVQLSEHPELKGFVLDFNEDEHIELIEFTEEEMITDHQKKLLELAELDITKLSDEDMTALGDVIEKFRGMLGLNESASIQEILGAVKTQEASWEEYRKAQAAIGDLATTKGVSMNNFSEESLKKMLDEQAEKVSKDFDAKLATLTTELAEAKAKIVELAEGDAAQAEADKAKEAEAPAEFPVETLKKPEADCQKEAEQAKTDLAGAKNWIPAFDDEKIAALELLKILANVKFKEGSALEGVKNMLMAVEGLTELTELASGYTIKEVEEFNAGTRKLTKPDTGFVAPKNAEVVDSDLSKKINEYAATHNLSYVESYEKLTELNQI